MCIVTPANESTPSISGIFGVMSAPHALIRNRAVTISPESSSTRYRLSASSNVADNTFVVNRIRDRSPYLSTQCSAYARNSLPGA